VYLLLWVLLLFLNEFFWLFFQFEFILLFWLFSFNFILVPQNTLYKIQIEIKNE
jgi:hypothetical protein